MSFRAPLLGLLVGCTALPVAAKDEPKAAYLDPSRPLEERVDDLVGRMTLEEKAGQMQDQAPGIPRLGVPAYGWWSEALHGVMTDHVTVFPQAIGLAATFDTDLMLRLATAIGDEGRAKYNETVQEGASTRFHGLTMFSPNINIFRDPRWGRGQETYGEDPYLTARMGVAFVRGLQGNDPAYLKLGATAKHYAVHSGPEPERHRFDVHPSPRDLRETYLPAFEALVREGKVESVMCAYNSVDGEPACASDALLGRFLRGEWGFRGYVVSDCGAIIDIHAHHHWKADAVEAAAAAVKAGTDVECADDADYLKLPEAVRRGLVSESAIDEAVKRLFRVRFRLGMFDPPDRVAYARTPVSVAESEPHKRLALEAARESIVLLKNDGVLPLSKTLKTIAVIGPNADDADVLRGNYAGTPSASVTPLAGIRAAVPGARVIYALGATRTGGAPLLPVPSSVLTPAEGGGSPGLRGEYFLGRELVGPPAFTRTDPEVSFDWGQASPRPGFPHEEFSVRWTGTLKVATGGKYEMGATADDGFRVRLDGRTIVEDWTQHAPTTRTESVELVAGKSYDVEIDYFQGPGGAVARFVWSPPAPPGQALRDAEEAARQADVVVAFLGLSSSLEGEEMPVDVAGFKGGDRTDIALPKSQEELLERLQATGKPVVLVLLSGSALGVGWAADHVPAIIQAWYGGQAAGTALADVLFGDVNPSGRLPVTFYASTADLPPFEDYAMEGRTYRYFEGTPLYPFGHGLSYTRFRYGSVRLGQPAVGPDETAEVSAEVTNAGARPGDEVVQLYITHLDARVRAPIRALAGVRRVSLKAGETATVSFAITPEQRRLFADDGAPIAGTGRLLVAVGGEQPGGRAATTEAKTAELTMR
jgi:beta-glucosidase